MEKKQKEIRAFWDERAREFGERPEATLGEKYLRLLEMKMMSRLIRKYRPGRVLDAGCGNGYAMKLYARRFPATKFVGMDFSPEMIAQANQRLPQNCFFLVGDVSDPVSFPDGSFDLIFTQRCLQNIADYRDQHQAIQNLRKGLSAGGTLCLMECSKDGVRTLNRWRKRLGRKPMNDIEPWHNNFLVDRRIIEDFEARVIHFSSLYMVLVKLVHPRLAALGYFLPQVGTFGYDKLYLIR
jgi:ubiquinone/menaquinone biosynthesis C-methylase UbiE